MVWPTHVDRSRLQRCETWRLGLASQQDARCWAGGAVVVSDGSGHGVDDRRGQSRRQPASAGLPGPVACNAYRTPTSATSADPTARPPLYFPTTLTPRASG